MATAGPHRMRLPRRRADGPASPLDRPGLSAMSLPDATAAITAIGNDYSYSEVFSRQVLAAGRPGDVTVGLTTSGNSENVVRALGSRIKGGDGHCRDDRSHGGRVAESGLNDSAGADDLRHGQGVQRRRACISGHVICEMVEAALFPAAMTDLASGATRSEPNVRRFSTVFLDRDPVPSTSKPAIEGHYVTSPADLVLLPGAAAGSLAQRRFGSGHTGDESRDGCQPCRRDAVRTCARPLGETPG